MADHLLDRMRSGLVEVAGADPRLLVLAALALAAALACDGAAWRSGCGAQGRPMRLHDAVSRYAVGSLVNALAPARVGTVARLGLFTRVAGGKATLATAASIGGLHVILLVGMVTIGLGPSMLPVPPAILAPVAVAAVVVAIAVRRRVGRRLGTARLAFWAILSAVLRLAAAAIVISALGVGSPVIAGCAMLAALGLSGTLPLTPGNAGVGAAAVAFALAGRGVPGSVGLTAGVAYGLMETMVSLGVGLIGGTVLLVGRRQQAQATWTPQPVPAARAV